MKISVRIIMNYRAHQAVPAGDGLDWQGWIMEIRRAAVEAFERVVRGWSRPSKYDPVSEDMQDLI